MKSKKVNIKKKSIERLEVDEIYQKVEQKKKKKEIKNEKIRTLQENNHPK